MQPDIHECGQTFERLTIRERPKRYKLVTCDRCFMPMPVADNEGCRYRYIMVVDDFGRTPRSPRLAGLRRKPVRKGSASEGRYPTPSTSRRPSPLSPTATITATETMGHSFGERRDRAPLNSTEVLLMPEYRNRADYARAAIEAYRQLDGAASGADRVVTISDLATDRLLLAHRGGIDPELVLRNAELHLQAEADLRRDIGRADLNAAAAV